MGERELQNAYNALRSELNEKIGKRDLLNVQIMQIERNLKGLYSLIKQDRINDARESLNLGVSDAIRTVMRMAGVAPLNAPQIKERLEIHGYDLNRFKNPSAVIHNTLARLAVQGEIIPIGDAFVVNRPKEEIAQSPITLRGNYRRKK